MKCRKRGQRGEIRYSYGMSDLVRITGIPYKTLAKKVERGEFAIADLMSVAKWLMGRDLIDRAKQTLSDSTRGNAQCTQKPS